MKMMRRLALVGSLAMVMAVLTAVPAGADSDGAVVRTSSGVWACGVGFDADSLGDLDWDCDIVNIARPNGGYTLVIHAQVQEDRMADFQASGVRHYETECLASYLFNFQEPFADQARVDSVRHFTPDGKMTETCNYQPITD